MPGIVGAGVAAEIAKTEMGNWVEHVGRLQSRLWDKMKETVPLIKLNGAEPAPQRLVTNLNVSAEFTEGEGLMLMADTKGFSIGSGTACVFRNLKLSPVLDAMGISPELAKAAVMISPALWRSKSASMCRRKSPSVTMPISSPASPVMPRVPKRRLVMIRIASAMGVSGEQSGNSSGPCMMSATRSSFWPREPPGCRGRKVEGEGALKGQSRATRQPGAHATALPLDERVVVGHGLRAEWAGADSDLPLERPPPGRLLRRHLDLRGLGRLHVDAR